MRSSLYIAGGECLLVRWCSRKKCKGDSAMVTVYCIVRLDEFVE